MKVLLGLVTVSPRRPNYLCNSVTLLLYGPLPFLRETVGKWVVVVVVVWNKICRESGLIKTYHGKYHLTILIRFTNWLKPLVRSVNNLDCSPNTLGTGYMLTSQSSIFPPDLNLTEHFTLVRTPWLTNWTSQITIEVRLSQF